MSSPAPERPKLHWMREGNYCAATEVDECLDTKDAIIAHLRAEIEEAKALLLGAEGQPFIRDFGERRRNWLTKLAKPEPQKAIPLKAIFDKWDKTFTALTDAPQPNSTAPENDTVILSGTEYRAMLSENAQLRATNHRLSRERDALFKRKIVDSHAKVWLPYWRACRRWITDLQKQIAQLQAQIDRLRKPPNRRRVIKREE